MKRKINGLKTIVPIVVALILVIGIVVLLLTLPGKKGKGTVATARIAYGQLSSKLSASGTLVNTKNDYEPTYLELLYEQLPQAFTGETVTGLSLTSELPLYSVISVEPDFADGKTLSTEDENAAIITLTPLRLTAEEVRARYAEEKGENDATDSEILLYFLGEVQMIYGGDFRAFVDACFGGCDNLLLADKTYTLTTDVVSDAILAEMKSVGYLDYSLSALNCKEGDYVSLTDSPFEITVDFWSTVFNVTEYDAAYIHELMQKGEPIYASIGVNALGGRKLMAQIDRLAEAANTSIGGVSVFAVNAKLIFPETVTAEDGGETLSYAYFDPSLTDDVVRDLHIELGDTVKTEELLSGFTCTVSAQKTIVRDKLIVPTKCIYYDSYGEPYVLLVKDDEEIRVKIRIDLSAGSEAAITPIEPGALHAGDALQYTVDTSLLDSLF